MASENLRKGLSSRYAIPSCFWKTACQHSNGFFGGERCPRVKVCLPSINLGISLLLESPAARSCLFFFEVFLSSPPAHHTDGSSCYFSLLVGPPAIGFPEPVSLRVSLPLGGPVPPALFRFPTPVFVVSLPSSLCAALAFRECGLFSLRPMDIAMTLFLQGSSMPYRYESSRLQEGQRKDITSCSHMVGV